jgi:hypothetical protein
MNFHIVFQAIGMMTIAATLMSLRREHIRTEYSTSWLLVGIIVTGLGLFPSALDRAARTLGMDPPVSFLIVAGVLVSAVVFEVSHVVSKLRDEKVVLAQRIAILEFQIKHGQENGEHGKIQQD